MKNGKFIHAYSIYTIKRKLRKKRKKRRKVSKCKISGKLYLHLQDTSKLQCVEYFLEGMLEKRKFE